MQPGAEQLLDLAAALRRHGPVADAIAGDDDQGRYRVDAEALDELGLFLHVDAVDLERVVVAPPLEHLREIPLDPARPVE